MREILRELMDKVRGLDMGAAGLKAWHQSKSGRDDGMLNINMFASLLRTIGVEFKLEKTGMETDQDDRRILGMLFRFFDKEDTGLVSLDEFWDVLVSGFDVKMKQFVREVRNQLKVIGYMKRDAEEPLFV